MVPNKASLYVQTSSGACLLFLLGPGHEYYLVMPRNDGRNELYPQLLRRMTKSGEYDRYVLTRVQLIITNTPRSQNIVGTHPEAERIWLAR